MDILERRFNKARLSLRATNPNPSLGPVGVLDGYGATFRSMSEDLGGFREMIQPGAFSASLRAIGLGKQDCHALVNHDPNLILGRAKNGTLTLGEDGKGLHFSCYLPNTSTGRDIRSLVERGDISDCSFAFQCDPGGDSWSECDDPDNPGQRIALRTLSAVKLYDVSVVCNPAYRTTSVGLVRHEPALGKGRDSQGDEGALVGGGPRSENGDAYANRAPGGWNYAEMSDEDLQDLADQGDEDAQMELDLRKARGVVYNPSLDAAPVNEPNWGPTPRTLFPFGPPASMPMELRSRFFEAQRNPARLRNLLLLL